MGPSVSPVDQVSGAPPPPLQTAGGHAFALAAEQLGTTLHLRLAGEFDLACVGRVEATLERASDARTKKVVFDLTELSFLDLAGLRTIIKANERARGEGLDVVVVRPRGMANRVFTLTRAREHLKLVHEAYPATGSDA